MFAETVLGERIAATADGQAVSRDDTAEIALRLHRTDSVPGEFELSVRQSGAAPDLRLRLVAREPSGVLLARLLGRDDRPPLSVSIAGDGPVSDWHGGSKPLPANSRTRRPISRSRSAATARCR